MGKSVGILSGKKLALNVLSDINRSTLKNSALSLATASGSAWKLPLTKEQLHQIYPGADISFLSWINQYAPLYDITTAKRMAMFLANTLKESEGFHQLRENMNYTTPARLLNVFGVARIGNLENAQRIIKLGPIYTANYVYGGRYGNGKGNNDGWDYRGGGLIQVTFKDNYKAAGLRIGEVQLGTQPMLIERPDIAVKASMDFWKAHGCNERADAGNFQSACKIVTGRKNAYLERQKYYTKAKKVFNLP